MSHAGPGHVGDGLNGEKGSLPQEFSQRGIWEEVGAHSRGNRLGEASGMYTGQGARRACTWGPPASVLVVSPELDPTQLLPLIMTLGRPRLYPTVSELLKQTGRPVVLRGMSSLLRPAVICPHR